MSKSSPLPLMKGYKDEQLSAGVKGERIDIHERWTVEHRSKDVKGSTWDRRTRLVVR